MTAGATVGTGVGRVRLLFGDLAFPEPGGFPEPGTFPGADPITVAAGATVAAALSVRHPGEAPIDVAITAGATVSASLQVEKAEAPAQPTGGLGFPGSITGLAPRRTTETVREKNLGAAIVQAGATVHAQLDVDRSTFDDDVARMFADLEELLALELV